MRVKDNVNYELWSGWYTSVCSMTVIIVPLRWRMLTMRDPVHVEGGGTDSIWEISVLSSQFCCEPKTVLKNKVLKIS